jgi:hypothetical protein
VAAGRWNSPWNSRGPAARGQATSGPRLGAVGAGSLGGLEQIAKKKDHYHYYEFYPKNKN